MPESLRIAIERAKPDGRSAAYGARHGRQQSGSMKTLAEQVAHRGHRGLHQPAETCQRAARSCVRTTGEDSPKVRANLEVLALDHGPGNGESRAVPARRLQHRAALRARAWARSSGSPRRRIFTRVPGQGTALLARWSSSRIRTPERPRRHGRLRIGAVNRSQARPGGLRRLLGDAVQTGDRLTVLVADGLGHGMEAKLASVGSRPHAARESRPCAAGAAGARATRRCAARAAPPSRWRGSTADEAPLPFAGVGQYRAPNLFRRGHRPASGFRQRHRRPSGTANYANSAIPGPTTDMLHDAFRRPGHRRRSGRLSRAWRCAIQP